MLESDRTRHANTLDETRSSSDDHAPDPRPARAVAVDVEALVRPGFVIRGPLGRGGMGQVFRAYDVTLEREVAIKLLTTADDPARLVSEARALAKIRHPNIAAIHDVHTSAAGTFIVMELAHGEPLDTIIARGPVAPERARHIGHQVALGLAAIHRAGLVHRDVKPANIIVGDERVTLIDLGLAIAPAEVDGRGGSRPYMAPEQWHGTADAASDVFALGATLFQAMTGAPPFGLETCWSRDAHVRPTFATSARAVPQDLASVVERALELDPTRRYPDGAAMARALDDLLQARRRRRFEQRILTATALFVLLVVALAALRHREASRQHALALVEGAGAALAERAPVAARARVRRALELDDSREARAAWQRIEDERLMWQVDFATNPWSLAVSDRLVLVGFDDALRRYDLRSGQALATHPMRGIVRAVAVAPGGHRVAGATASEVVQIGVDGETTRITDDALATRHSLFFGPDDALYIAAAPRSASLQGPTVLWRWSQEPGAVLERVRGHAGKVLGHTFDRAGGLWTIDDTGLLHGPATRAQLWHDASEHYVTGLGIAADPLRVARIVDGGAIELRDSAGDLIVQFAGAQAGSVAATLTGDARLLVVPTRGQHLTIWNVTTRDHATWPAPDRTQYLAASPDGARVVALHPRSATAWRVRDPADEPIAVGRLDGWYAAAFHPDGRHVALADVHFGIVLHELATGRRVARFVGHEDRVDTLRFDARGEVLFSTSSDFMVRVWDLARGTSIPLAGTPHGFWDLAVHPTDTIVATAGEDPWIGLWDVGDPPGLITRLRAARPGARFFSVVFSPDGRHVIAGGLDGVLSQWDVATGTEHAEALTEGDIVRFAPDGPDAVWAATTDGLLVRWSIALHRVVEVVVTPWRDLRGVDRRGDAWRFVVGSDLVLATATVADDRLVLREHDRWRLRAGEVSRAVFSDDGRWVAAPGDPGYVAIWDIEARRLAFGAPGDGLPPRSPERDAATATARLGNGLLVTGTGTGQIAVTDPATGARLVERWLHGPIAELVVEGTTIAARSTLGDRLTLVLGALTEDYCELVARVWREVPYVWESGRIEPRAPPHDHLCRPLEHAP